MDNVVLLVGLIISPLVTVVGLVLNHQSNLRTAAALAIKNKSEAEKIEAETNELTIKNNSEQMKYWIKITEDLRNEVAELRKEKNALAVENMALRQQVNAQELEIESLRKKVTALEGKK